MSARVAAVLAAFATALALCVVGIASPAQADDGRPCVTHDEYRDVEDGWSKERVNNKFDSNGTLVGTISDNGEVVEKEFHWDACWDNSTHVHVVFKVECCSLRVRHKYTYG